MKIVASTLALDSQHEQSRLTQVQERLRFWRGNEAAPGQERAASRPSVWLDLSAAARAALAASPPTPAASAAATPAATSPDTTSEVSADTGDAEPRMLVLARMIEALTGIHVRIVHAEDLQADQASSAPASQTASQAGDNAQRVGWSLTYDRVSVHTESETLQFSAQGVVQTTDGRTITFQTSLQLQRSSTTVEQVSLRSGDAARPMKDPLVLHFDGALPNLTDTRFAFDLNADGQTEDIPFVGQGSGVLVLDRNGNGQIDDGRELFGALSGDGFADLAQLDSDGNGWIDEADPAFAQLQIWQKDAAGSDRYSTLQDLGVGALSLARTNSPYSLRGAGDSVLGQVRASGLYLQEDGQAGVMQQIDLAA